MTSPGRLCFADVQLDLASARLTRAGEPVHVTPKAFAVLEQLARARGALVTREALLDALWPGMVVGGDVLTRAVAELRRALDDDAKAPRYIATVHRRGFRMVPPVLDAGPMAAPGPASAADAAPPSDDGTPAGAPLGRANEFAQGTAAIRALTRGSGGVVCLHGEPGIGKSHLLGAWLGHARAQGVRVHLLHADDPLLARSLAEATHDGTPAASATGALSAPLAGWDGAAALRTLHASLARRLAAQAREAPLLLAFDDLERASADTFDLLRQLDHARVQAPLLLLLAWRDVDRPRDDQRDAALLALRHGPAPRIDIALRGLDDEAAQTLAERAGARLPHTTLARAAGNPLFVSELARFVAGMPVDHVGSRLPEGLRALLRARLDRLPAATRTLLQAAAVIGTHGSRALLDAVSDASRAQVDDALNDAMHERLLLQGVDGDWRFVHGLVRDAAYASIAPGARARLHSAIGHALARRVGGANELPLSTLAQHFERGLPQDAPRAIAHAHEAGLQALRAGAGAESAQLLDHALERASTRDDVPANALCEMLIAAGYAHTLAGRPQRARALAHSAEREARAALAAVGDPGAAQPPASSARAETARATLVRALRLRCDLAPNYPQEPAVTAWLDEALALVPDADAATRAALLARRAFQDYLRGDVAAHAERSRDAVGIARTADDAAALDDALTSHAFALAHPQHTHALRALHDERMGLARRLGDRHREFDVRRQRLAQCMELGPIDAVRTEFAALEALAALIDTPSARASILRARAGFAIAGGDLDAAWRFAQDAVAEGERATDAGTVGAIALLQFGAILGLQEGGVRSMPELRDPPGAANSLARAATIYYAAHHGAPDYARWQLRELAASGFAALPADATRGVALCNLASSCVHLGDETSAAVLYRALRPWRARSLTVLCDYNAGCGARVLGLLAGLLGRTRAAAAHFATALRVDARMQAETWRLHTLVDRARVLGTAEARAELPAVEAACTRLGLTALARSALELQGHAAGG